MLEVSLNYFKTNISQSSISVCTSRLSDPREENLKIDFQGREGKTQTTNRQTSLNFLSIHFFLLFHVRKSRSGCNESKINPIFFRACSCRSSVRTEGFVGEGFPLKSLSTLRWLVAGFLDIIRSMLNALFFSLFYER